MHYKLGAVAEGDAQRQNSRWMAWRCLWPTEKLTPDASIGNIPILHERTGDCSAVGVNLADDESVER
jgi:hypothetical protein